MAQNTYAFSALNRDGYGSTMLHYTHNFNVKSYINLPGTPITLLNLPKPLGISGCCFSLPLRRSPLASNGTHVVTHTHTHKTEYNSHLFILHRSKLNNKFNSSQTQRAQYTNRHNAKSQSQLRTLFFSLEIHSSTKSISIRIVPMSQYD